MVGRGALLESCCKADKAKRSRTPAEADRRFVYSQLSASWEHNTSRTIGSIVHEVDSVEILIKGARFAFGRDS